MDATVAMDPAGAKRQRLDLSITQEQRLRLEEAAAGSGLSLRGFVLGRAMEAARDTGMAMSEACVTEERWASFCAMLDRLKEPDGRPDLSGAPQRRAPTRAPAGPEAPRSSPSISDLSRRAKVARESHSR
jgi:uncharacterized protein (DUF1778 family)